jgi:hypothetical protein
MRVGNLAQATIFYNAIKEWLGQKRKRRLTDARRLAAQRPIGHTPSMSGHRHFSVLVLIMLLLGLAGHGQPEAAPVGGTALHAAHSMACEGERATLSSCRIACAGSLLAAIPTRISPPITERRNQPIGDDGLDLGRTLGPDPPPPRRSHAT